MEYLVTVIAPIVHQRSAHQCFVLSLVRSNKNIVWLSSDSDDLKKNPHHIACVSLEFCCDQKLLSFLWPKAIHLRPAVTASSAAIHRGAPFLAGSRVIEINNTRKPPEFPDNLEVFRV